MVLRELGPVLWVCVATLVAGCAHTDDRLQRRLRYQASQDLGCPEGQLQVDSRSPARGGKAESAAVRGCGRAETYHLVGGDWIDSAAYGFTPHEPWEGHPRPEEGSEPRAPHSCHGAVVEIRLPHERLQANDLFKDEVLTDDDSSLASPADDQRPKRWPLAEAIVRVLNARADVFCRMKFDSDGRSAAVSCGESNRDACDTSAEDGASMLARVQKILAPVVEASVDDCPCRVY